MTTKSIPLTDELHAYLVAHGSPPDEIIRDLAEETRSVLPEHATMQVAPEQAAFLTFLTRLLGVRQAVEVGTFTGLSSLAIARGLPDGGRLTCFDISEEFTGIARRYWARAGVQDLIDLRIGPAAEGCGSCRTSGTWTSRSSTRTRPATRSTGRSWCPGCVRVG